MATNTQQKQQDPLQKSAPAIAQPLQSNLNKSSASSGTNTAQKQIDHALQQITPPQGNNNSGSNNQPKGGNNPTPAVQNNSNNNAQKNNPTPNGGNKPQSNPVLVTNNGGNNNSPNQPKGGNNPVPVGNNSNNSGRNNSAPNGGGNNSAPGSNKNQPKGGNNSAPVAQNNSNNAQKNNPALNGGNKPQSNLIPVTANGSNNNSPNQPKGGNNQGANPSLATATANANGIKATSTGNNTATVINGNAQVKTQTTTNANGSAATATASVKAQVPTSGNGNAAPTAQAKPAAVKAAPGKGPAAQDLANIGTTINDFFNQTIGGVNPLNQQTLVNDANNASTQIQQEIKDGAFGAPTSTAAIHAATIAGNFQQSIGAINGTANAQPQKQLGDITRDINDIIQGDPTLMKGLNTTPLPNAANPATPFQDNAAQTSFLNNYNNSVTTIANTAVAAAKSGMPNSTQSKAAIQAVQNLINTSNQFTTSQGGIYSARFNNELATNGTNGAAGNALVTAIQNGDPTGAMNAVAVLQGNAGDLGANMTPTTGGMFAFAANA